MSPSPPSVDIAMVDLGPEHALFDEAVEAIQETISGDDRRSFRHHADTSSLLEDLKTICDCNPKEQRLRACQKRIALFSCTFAPYFDLLSTCVQVRPDWRAWFWGALRLVFKVGSHYTLFLEKITDMFETTAHMLPRYQQLHEACKQQSHFNGQNHDERLAVLMSYVYADIVQFCLDAYRLFYRGSHGVALRHLRLSSPTILWRPLDSRFALLEARLVKHKTWLECEFKQHSDQSAVASQRREYIEFLHNQTEIDANCERVEQRMAKRMRRVDKVKAWLSNCCAYRDLFEHRLRRRHPNSCAWFLATEEYCKWKHAPFDQLSANDTDELERSWHDRVLFVQAKPGFGKSYISGAVIDDLSAEADSLNIDDEYEPPSTAFFHFNAAHLYCIHPNDAFRALAYQLIHTHRHDRATLDAISLVMRKAPPRARASSDDVLTVVSLLLRQHPTFIVIDGIDECSDPDLFLHSLPEVCRRSDTRVILFSRPDIRVPLEYQKWASDSPHIVALNEESNKQDIEVFVTENLNRMADQGFFGINMDRSLISEVASRSNSMFLWASLLLKYLQSPDLSPDERRLALEQAHRLEGLDSLYCHILAMLDLRRQKDKQIVANLFRWLSLSINRLCLPALQTALALTPGQRTTDSSYIANFSESIPRLTCGLVEVTKCSVVFTHRSIKEYLQSPEYQESDFSLVDEEVAHAHLAARCLSYLAHDVPKRPLARLHPLTRPGPVSYAMSSGISMRTSRSGDSGYKSMSSASDSENFPAPTFSSIFLSHRPQQPTAAFDADMPFLRYASLCWPIHLTRALSATSPSPRSPNLADRRSSGPFENTPWLPVLSTFLTDRAAVTAWVEASWRYSLPPNLSRLIPLLSTLKTEIPPATIEGREIRWVVHGVRELSEALSELKEEYATTLRENPSLIWQWRGYGGAVLHGRPSASGPFQLRGHVDAVRGSARGGFWPVWDEGAGRVQGVML